MIESIEENQKKYDVADLARKILEIIDSGDEEKQIRVFREFNRLMTSGVPMEQVTDEMKKHTEE
jgi:2-oxo-4-hydroxy-4-carboxy--5-ureidoimidazoline (OHCU) decarboxylase